MAGLHEMAMGAGVWTQLLCKSVCCALYCMMCKMLLMEHSVHQWCSCTQPLWISLSHHLPAEVMTFVMSIIRTTDTLTHTTLHGLKHTHTED